MANEEDFTFCRVGEARKVSVDVNNIHTKDGINKNSGSIWKAPSSQRESTVGSLSFNVIDASSAVDKQPKQTGQVSGSSIKASSGSGSKAKPLTRAKAPFEKSYSQVEWLRLTRTHPDLADLKGQPNTRLIPMSEVKQHRSEDSMWTVLKGRVYNITTYIKYHPGEDELMKGVGRDCTSLFNKNHAWVNAEFLLEKCLVGILDDGKNKT